MDHEKQISDAIHNTMSAEERTRASSIGNGFDFNLDNFVEASFLKIYYSGRMNLRLLDAANGDLINSRECLPQFNVSKFMGKSLG